MTAAINHPLHATAVAVAVDADGPLAGALLLGGSGAGKSALALSLIETCPFRRTALIADDFVLVEASCGWLTARAPDRIAGMMEIRGFGPAKVPSILACRLVLAADLGAQSERLPAPRRFDVGADGSEIPLYPFRWRGAEASAPHRMRRMIATILGGQSLQCTQDRRSV